MSIALSTLAIIFALIPAIVFLNSYYAGHFPRQLANLTPLGELALYFLWAIPIDALALHCVHPQLQDEEVRAFIYLVMGKFEWANDLRWFSAQDPFLPGGVSMYSLLDGESWWHIAKTYLIVVFLAGLAGIVVRRVVWALRLDVNPVSLGLLRFKSEWYYKLMGRVWGVPRRIIPKADIIVNMGEDRTQLFSGIVKNVRSNNRGEIEEIVLGGAMRWKTVKDSKVAKPIGDRGGLVWETIHGVRLAVPVGGDSFIIRGGHVCNMNVIYGRFTNQPKKWSWKWWWNGIWMRIRSFALEEP